MHTCGSLSSVCYPLLKFQTSFHAPIPKTGKQARKKIKIERSFSSAHGPKGTMSRKGNIPQNLVEKEKETKKEGKSQDKCGKTKER